jgi:hypothetical protein
MSKGIFDDMTLSQMESLDRLFRQVFDEEAKSGVALVGQTLLRFYSEEHKRSVGRLASGFNVLSDRAEAEAYLRLDGEEKRLGKMAGDPFLGLQKQLHEQIKRLRAEDDQRREREREERD